MIARSACIVCIVCCLRCVPAFAAEVNYEKAVADALKAPSLRPVLLPHKEALRAADDTAQAFTELTAQGPRPARSEN